MSLPVKRMVLALVILLGCLAPLRPAKAAQADSPPARELGLFCAYGAGTLASATYLEAAPVLVAGTLPWAAGSVIIANAITGCAISSAGGLAARVFTWLYDSVF